MIYDAHKRQGSLFLRTLVGMLRAIKGSKPESGWDLLLLSLPYCRVGQQTGRGLPTVELSIRKSQQQRHKTSVSLEAEGASRAFSTSFCVKPLQASLERAVPPLKRGRLCGGVLQHLSHDFPQTHAETV